MRNVRLLDVRCLYSLIVWLTVTTVTMAQQTRYVSPDGGNIPPYSSWATAARVIQDAVNVSAPGDLILVTNGVYNTGGMTAPGYALTNRVYVAKAITIRGVNGPGETIIEGRSTQPAIRGVHLVNGAVLDGITVRGGGTLSAGHNVFELGGGGVLLNQGGLVTNCVIVSSWAWSRGGGVLLYGGGLVTKCIITDCGAEWGSGAFIEQDGRVASSWITNNFSLGTAGGGVMLDGGGVVIDCHVTDNHIGILTPGGIVGGSGGGIHLRDGGQVIDCVIERNQAGTGGGVSLEGGGLVESSMIGNNVALEIGGGIRMSNGVVRACRIVGNRANINGGGFSISTTGTISNCWIIENTAVGQAGGGQLFDGVEVRNSVIAGNHANSAGGLYLSGAASTVRNSTIIGNTAGSIGGVHFKNGGVLINSMVYHNEADFDADYLIDGDGAVISHSCLPSDPGGAGNIEDAPRLSGITNPYLLWDSPCIDAGDSTQATGTDIDHAPRVNGTAVDIGAAEYYPMTRTGSLHTVFRADYTNAAVGFPLTFTSLSKGRAHRMQWDFKDGRTATNTPVIEHAWSMPGDFDVTLTLYNNDYPGGVSTSLTVTIIAGYTNYVSKTGTHIPPFTSWDTAATNIQAAIDANPVVGGTVMVGPGTYSDVGYVTNDVGHVVALTRPVTLRSSEGRVTTILQGGGVSGNDAVRCALLTKSSVLDGFTLTGGQTAALNDRLRGGGAGAWLLHGGTITNCVITANRAHYAGGGVLTYGGGVVLDCLIDNNSGTNINSLGGGVLTYKGGMIAFTTISANSANDYGGGVYADGGGVFYDCTISGNTANGHYGRGGGVYVVNRAVFYQCLIANNTALGSDSYPNHGGGVYLRNGGTLHECRILDNRAQRAGGVYMDDGGVLIQCEVTGNGAIGGWDSGNPHGMGGGIFIERSGVIDSSVISSNWANIHGGGIVGYQGGIVSNSTIGFNIASNGVAGGIMMQQDGTLVESIIINNLAPSSAGGEDAGDAGGIRIGAGTLVDRCIVAGNEAYRFAGGIYLANGGTVRNSLLAHNGALGAAGGALLLGGGVIENCTVSDNIVPGAGWGGGLYFYQGGQALNSIIYHNEAANEPNYIFDDIADVIHYSCTTPAPGGAGNITEPPVFVDRPQFDFRLQRTSPGIDAGQNQPWMTGARDLDGRTRILNDTVDMGAFEFGYRITVECGPNGVIVPGADDAWVEYDGNITFTVTADANYHIADVLVNGISIENFGIGSNTTQYTFLNVTDNDQSIAATFAADPVKYILTYTAGAGGMIEGVSPQTVDEGEDGTQVEAKPEAGAVFDRWSDGVTDNPRQDIGVRDDLTVSAQFRSQAGVPIEWYAGHGLGIDDLPEKRATRIYWTAFYPSGNWGVSRLGLDGDDRQDNLCLTASGFFGVAVDKDQAKMYFATPMNGLIERANSDGTGRETLISDVNPVGITLDLQAGKIYWGDYTWGHAVIKRADLDGTNIEELTPHLGNGCTLEGMAIDVPGGKIYWVERMAKRIRRANLDGSAMETILTCEQGAGNSFDVAVHNGHVYWTDTLSAGMIHRADIDGGNVVNGILTNLNKPRGLTIDPAAGKLYWLSDGHSSLSRANLDGSDVETVAIQIVSPYGIALDYERTSHADGAWLPSWSDLDAADSDGDGVPNWQEYIADTCPTNAQSVLRFQGVIFTNGVPRLQWQGGTHARQIIERTDDLTPPPVWNPVWTNIPPTATKLEWSDNNAPDGPWFYRIRVNRE